MALWNQKRARRSFSAELILALDSSSQFHSLEKNLSLRWLAQNVAAPTAVVTCCFYFVAAFTAPDFCLSVNTTVLCGYVTLSRYWVSLQFNNGIQKDVATQTSTEIQLNWTPCKNFAIQC